MYFSRAKEREKKKTSLICQNVFYTHLHIYAKTYKGKRKLSSVSHILMWKWQLSAEMVGWGSSSSGNK